MNRVVQTIHFVAVLSLALSTSVRGDQAEGIASYEEFVFAQISEGLSLAAGAKAAVTEHYFDRGQFPRSNEEAGLAPPYDINGKLCRRLQLVRRRASLRLRSHAAVFR